MFRNKLFRIFRNACRLNSRKAVVKIRNITPITLGLITTVSCEEKSHKADLSWDPDSLEHEFLIRQATTVSVNAATQLLTVTLVAVQDTSERLREALSKEICLVKQALEWGDDGTPPHHWDQLVAVRGSLSDLNHNLRTLFRWMDVCYSITPEWLNGSIRNLAHGSNKVWNNTEAIFYPSKLKHYRLLREPKTLIHAEAGVSYMDYAEKLATTAAEISYLSGNIAASDAICERIDHACRACNTQKQLTHELQQESLELQQQAILNAPHLEDKLKSTDDVKQTVIK